MFRGRLRVRRAPCRLAARGPPSSSERLAATLRRDGPRKCEAERFLVFHHGGPFRLQSGKELPELRVAYETWGRLSEARDNVVLLQCGSPSSSHARSHPGNPERGWWEDFIGPGKPLDTNRFHVVCSNHLGGCAGSSGPSSVDPRDGRRYGSRWPRIEVQDMVSAQFALLDHLGIERVHACVGTSLGGMQSLLAAARFPDRVGRLVTISACARPCCGSIAFRHVQREAITSDPNWRGGDYYDGRAPTEGLRLARQVGTITYRSGEEWQHRFGQRRSRGHSPGPGASVGDAEFEIERYLLQQAKIGEKTQDANTLLCISRAIDRFTVEAPGADGQPCLAAGLARARQPALVIGVQSDILFPVWQQREVAQALRAAGNRHVVYYELDSVHGHSAFLHEADQMGPAILGHLSQGRPAHR